VSHINCSIQNTPTFLPYTCTLIIDVKTVYTAHSKYTDDCLHMYELRYMIHMYMNHVPTPCRETVLNTRWACTAFPDNVMLL